MKPCFLTQVRNQNMCVTYSFWICLLSAVCEKAGNNASRRWVEPDLSSSLKEAQTVSWVVSFPDLTNPSAVCFQCCVGKEGPVTCVTFLCLNGMYGYLVCEWRKTSQSHSKFRAVCLCNRPLATHAQWRLMTVWNVLKNSTGHIYTLYWFLGIQLTCKCIGFHTIEHL